MAYKSLFLPIFFGLIISFFATYLVNWWQDSGPWDLYYHLGGNGPWIKMIDGIVGGDVFPPHGCTVVQVHMMSRHAERYPTTNAGGRMLDLLQRIKDSNISFVGDLSFINDWKYFASDPAVEHNQLTATGPYAGTLSAFRTGAKMRSRYWQLLYPLKTGKRLTLWASDSRRVIESAEYFANGLWGLDWSSKHAELRIIPETSKLGADTLTPGDTCLAYCSDTSLGHDYGYTQLFNFRDTYLPSIIDRFRWKNPQINFTNSEVYSMQEMCGFETLVRGSSPWCEVFTHKDWLNFEYARDVLHYYRAGPGNRYAPTMGWLWLNATSKLLEEGPSAGVAFFSFVHDGDILPMLAALDLFNSTGHLPTNYRPGDRDWHTSQIVPMGGRVIFELLQCDRSQPSPQKGGPVRPYKEAAPRETCVQQQPKNEKGHYVRINVNDGIVALPNCQSGPGSSCPLGEFLAHVESRGEEIGDFKKVCGLSEKSPDGITFLHQ